MSNQNMNIKILYVHEKFRVCVFQHSYFTDKESETKMCQMICPKSHKDEKAEF